MVQRDGDNLCGQSGKIVCDKDQVERPGGTTLQSNEDAILGITLRQLTVIGDHNHILIVG